MTSPINREITKRAGIDRCRVAVILAIGTISPRSSPSPATLTRPSQWYPVWPTWWSAWWPTWWPAWWSAWWLVEFSSKWLEPTQPMAQPTAPEIRTRIITNQSE